MWTTFSEKYKIYQLHSRMPSEEQMEIFDKPPPGAWKIIAATNIAEISLTIDDVVYVIDCGKMKVDKFDIKQNLVTLNEEWVSTANATQRKGRAGRWFNLYAPPFYFPWQEITPAFHCRCQAGICYRLYTKSRANKLQKFPVPEIQRSKLEEIILTMKILQLGKANVFLSHVMDPPSPDSVALSLQVLVRLGALDENEILTPLGYHLAKLPLDPGPGNFCAY